MSIGSAVRSLFGPAEPAVARAYRRIFVDVEALAREVAGLVAARRVLEVGAGEGQFTEALARVFPEAEILGIDITPRVGTALPGPAGAGDASRSGRWRRWRRRTPGGSTW